MSGKIVEVSADPIFNTNFDYKYNEYYTENQGVHRTPVRIKYFSEIQNFCHLLWLQERAVEQPEGGVVPKFAQWYLTLSWVYGYGPIPMPVVHRRYESGIESPNYNRNDR